MRSGNFSCLFKGFTLIELLVVLTIVALLLSLVSPKYFNHIDRAKETALKQDLHFMRVAIDQYFGDHGIYPESLEKLVELAYLDKVPVDPITESAETWIITPPEPPLEGEVYDVNSGSEGFAKDGTIYNSW
ncbi:MAG: prepilin-type N-terminal cleavage/methylation domain-containing protein [Methylophilaceae bacterium]|nr:MAG: prepilin-type N-terminal cleavage/methylation domain-containing protein [Methylophilaceae bacterium]